MKYMIAYDNGVVTKFVKTGIKKIDKFLVFKIKKEIHVVMLTKKPRFVPSVFNSRELYYVFQDDQNTFDIQNGSILDTELKDDWIKYLHDHPEHRHLTAEPKRPENAPPHHIIEDIAHISLDGQVLKNLYNRARGSQMSEWLFPFIAGMGASIFVLMLIGSIYPENFYLRIGK